MSAPLRMPGPPATYIPSGYDLETGLAAVGSGWAELVRRAFIAPPET